jgi:putative ABC transport system permease protein
MAALSFLLALGTVHVALPSFNALAGTHIGIPFSNGFFWLGMSGYVLFTGLLAGCRPALYLSSMQPVKVLKGKLTTSGPTGHFRQVLVVLQYTCSIALIIATIVVYQQIDHARNRPRGYDPNRLVISEAVGVPFAALKHDVMETGVVSNITECLMPRQSTWRVAFAYRRGHRRYRLFQDAGDPVRSGAQFYRQCGCRFHRSDP